MIKLSAKHNQVDVVVEEESIVTACRKFQFLLGILSLGDKISFNDALQAERELNESLNASSSDNT